MYNMIQYLFTSITTDFNCSLVEFILCTRLQGKYILFRTKPMKWHSNILRTEAISSGGICSGGLFFSWGTCSSSGTAAKRHVIRALLKGFEPALTRLELVLCVHFKHILPYLFSKLFKNFFYHHHTSRHSPLISMKWLGVWGGDASSV